MLELVSISSDSATGRLLRLKSVSSCLTPSSKISKSFSVRSVMYLFVESVTVTFIDTTSMADRKAGCCARISERHGEGCRQEKEEQRSLLHGGAQGAAVKGQYKPKTLANLTFAFLDGLFARVL